MLWLLFAFLSAALLGFYDVCKKKALQGSAVVPVLFLNTLFSSLIFLPFCLPFVPSSLHIPFGGWEVQRYVVGKSLQGLSSGLYFVKVVSEGKSWARKVWINR